MKYHSFILNDKVFNEICQIAQENNSSTAEVLRQVIETGIALMDVEQDRDAKFILRIGEDEIGIGSIQRRNMKEMPPWQPFFREGNA